MTGLRLSVLICGLYERMPGNTSDVGPLGDLLYQADTQPAVEVLTLYDNRHMTVGRKRQILASIAQGEYMAYVDDDDTVAEDYVTSLLEAIEQHRGVDVIHFYQRCIRGDLGGRIESCRYGLTLDYASGVHPDGSMWWHGRPAHTACWRTELVQGIEWIEADFGEDVDWVSKACRVARTEYRIPKTLYTYNFNPDTSRTRGR